MNEEKLMNKFDNSSVFEEDGEWFPLDSIAQVSVIWKWLKQILKAFVVEKIL